MKVLRKIIQIDEERCDGCGLCVPSCAEGAIQIIDGKAKVIADKFCDGLGACIGECPNNALKIVEREAEEFDEAAVHEHLNAQNVENKAQRVENRDQTEKLPCGCPSTHVQIFEKAPASKLRESKPGDEDSALGHWPVKIRLVPAKAPFLKGATLSVIADCVPVAYPTLHRDFLRGNAVLIGCPKFDNKEEYIQKFVDIFKTAGIKGVKSIYMEVPCCSALPTIVKKAMDAAGVTIPLETIVISSKGNIVQ